MEMNTGKFFLKIDNHTHKFSVCNHVKLEICSFVMNFNSGGVFSKGTVLVLCTKFNVQIGAG